MIGGWSAVLFHSTYFFELPDSSAKYLLLFVFQPLEVLVVENRRLDRQAAVLEHSAQGRGEPVAIAKFSAQLFNGRALTQRESRPLWYDGRW
jgi:hypothetical protein